MHKYALDFLTVTERAALSALQWVGKGDKNVADKAATDTMRQQLNEIDFAGRVVIGEGEMDEAPMLYIGEKVGTGTTPEIDIAVDPIEGTTPTINGQENGITVIAAAPKGTLFHAPDMYMKKIAVGPKAKGTIDIQAPLLENMQHVAAALNKDVSDLRIMVQNRPRHESYIQTMRDAGAKVYLFDNNDIIASILTNVESGKIDMMYHIGGAPEGVISAVALKALGGEIQAQLMPENDQEIERCKQMGINDVHQALRHEDLVSANDCIFSATGITGNALFKGIDQVDHQWKTHSVLITGANKRIRFVESVY